MKIKRGNKKYKKEQKHKIPKRLPDIIVQRKHNNFTIISNEAIRDPNMSWKAKGLLTLLIGNKEGWYSYKETIKKYGSDREKSVSSGLKELEKNGYLIRLRYRKKKGPNKCILGSVWLCSDTTNEFNWDDVYAQLTRYGLEPVNTKPNCGKATSTKGTMYQKYNERKEQLTIPINNNTKNNNNKSLDHLDDFEKWYKIYPRKVSKQGAKKAWIKIQNLPKNERPSFDTLFLAVQQQSQSDQWKDKKYIPHPSTWLNQRRWEDELESTKSNNNNNPHPSTSINPPDEPTHYYNPYGSHCAPLPDDYEEDDDYDFPGILDH
jgi:hypothetical protein